MEVLETRTVTPGSYTGIFKEFMIDPKTGGLVHSTPNGEMVRYLALSDEGVQIPGSFHWDFSHYSIHNALGAFGTCARALEKTASMSIPDTFLRKLEAKLQDVGARVSIWVPDTGWIGAVKPESGSFHVKFEKFLSRDDKDVPMHVRKTGVRTGRGGKSYSYDEDTFNTLLKIVSGNHEGSTFVHRLFYNIKQHEPGKFQLDKSGGRGKAFYEFFHFHGVYLDTFNPLSCNDPDNILPEMEPILINSSITLIAEISNGWVDKLALSPTAVRVDSIDLDNIGGNSEKVKKTRRRRSKAKATTTARGAKTVRVVQPSPYAGWLRSAMSKTYGGKMFGIDGNLLISSSVYKKFIMKHKLPKKLPDKYSNRDIKKALLSLGFTTIANKVET